MKLLLTSSGINNASIHDALVGLLGKPIDECSALCIPTAIYPFSVGPTSAYQFLTGQSRSPLAGLGWKSLGILELSVLPSIDRESWVPVVEQTEALLVWGGDVLFLRNWMRQSGLADLFASLRREIVYVGVSAGSMVTASLIGESYTGSKPPIADDIRSEDVVVPTPEGETMNVTFATAPGMGLVDFSLFPHVGHERFPENSLENLETWAAKLGRPTYAIDDQTAIQVVDGQVEVVSEGHWKLFNS